jgi:hypothetical protein
MRAGTLKRGAGEEEHPCDAGKRARERGDDDERINPGLEVDDDEEVNQHHGEHQTGRQPDERGAHGLHLAADGGETPARQILLRVVHDLAHFRRHAAKVPPLHAGVYVHDGLHIVVRDHRRLGTTLELSARFTSNWLGAPFALVIGRS